MRERDEAYARELARHAQRVKQLERELKTQRCAVDAHDGLRDELSRCAAAKEAALELLEQRAAALDAQLRESARDCQQLRRERDEQVTATAARYCRVERRVSSFRTCLRKCVCLLFFGRPRGARAFRFSTASYQ